MNIVSYDDQVLINYSQIVVPYVCIAVVISLCIAANSCIRTNRLLLSVSITRLCDSCAANAVSNCAWARLTAA